MRHPPTVERNAALSQHHVAEINIKRRRRLIFILWLECVDDKRDVERTMLRFLHNPSIQTYDLTKRYLNPSPSIRRRILMPAPTVST